MSEPHYEVLLTKDAEQDLERNYRYVARSDSIPSADYVLDGLLGVVENLACFPERGSYPDELIGLGIKAFRQALFKPYRVVYRVIGQKVYIMLIADGRRDMQSLLASRLLSA